MANNREEMTVDEYRKQVFEITLDDMPPSLNLLYANVEIKGRTRRVLSEDGRLWKNATALIVRTQANITGFSIQPGDLFAMTITLQAPNVLQWDLDGKAKLLIDAVCAAFGINDRHLFELHMRKRRGETSVGIRIEAL